MILNSSFGSFAPPQILAECLRHQVRELQKLGYDPKEIVDFLQKSLANPDGWLKATPRTFTVTDFYAAFAKQTEQSNDGQPG